MENYTTKFSMNTVYDVCMIEFPPGSHKLELIVSDELLRTCSILFKTKYDGDDESSGDTKEPVDIICFNKDATHLSRAHGGDSNGCHYSVYVTVIVSGSTTVNIRPELSKQRSSTDGSQSWPCHYPELCLVASGNAIELMAKDLISCVETSWFRGPISTKGTWEIVELNPAEMEEEQARTGSQSTNPGLVDYNTQLRITEEAARRRLQILQMACEAVSKL
ncbi:hypothetical protein FALBO_1527 [Fusarium albosuccineum]|uniref:Uncharacterized protein n=1 Tax=Fusarium albosuccineum TaxID=1237068 RepID=A0A8H4LPH5_9HYPO|nr:hypothetical protein FALBO_1527 [Fusarium albosuccineum]